MLALVWRGPEVNKLEQVSSDGYLVGGGPVQWGPMYVVGREPGKGPV